MKKVSNKLVYKYYLYKKDLNKSNINVYKYYFYNRVDIIISIFINRFVVFYNGKSWVYININRWFLGKKLGLFSWNRKKSFLKKLKKK